MEDTNLSFGNLVDSLQSVKKELEVLRQEHEHIIEGIFIDKDKGEGGYPKNEVENESKVEEAVLLQESREAVIAESMNRLNGGAEESEILLALVQYLNSLEGDKLKLKAQVRRLADENNWLRQELEKTQEQLQDAECETCKLKEEKKHLEYTLSLSRIVSSASGQLSTNENIPPTDNEQPSNQLLEDKSTITEANSSTNKKKSSLGQSNRSSTHPDSYTKLHELAVQHFRQGRHDTALSLCKKAVQDIRINHGPINSDRGDLMNIMVVIYREQGRLNEAADLLQEVLEIREKLNGRDHQSVAATLNNLSVLKGKLGDFKNAESLCRRALEIRQKLLGSNHPDVAQQLVNLASLCQNLGKYEEVEWYYQRAIEIYQVEYGPEDENVIKTLNFLGNCYMKQGDVEAAERIFKRVRSSVQIPEGGRESREQSGSPTLLTRTESPETKSSSAGVAPKSLSTSKLANESSFPRKNSEPSISINNPVTVKQKVSDNVRKLFKWGSSAETNL